MGMREVPERLSSGQEICGTVLSAVYTFEKAGADLHVAFDDECAPRVLFVSRDELDRLGLRGYPCSGTLIEARFAYARSETPGMMGRVISLSPRSRP